MIDDVRGSHPRPSKVVLITPESDQEAENRLFLAGKGWARKNGSTLRALANAARMTEGEADAALTRLRERGQWPYRMPISGTRGPRIRTARLEELAMEYANVRVAYLNGPSLESRSELERAEIRLASALNVQPCGYADHGGYRYRVVQGALYRERSPKYRGHAGPNAAPGPFVKTMHRVMIKEVGS